MVTIKDLMSDELYTLKYTETLQKASELMVNKQIRHIPIVNEHEEFVGLLTKRDVLAVSVSALADIDVAERLELESTIPISEVMITEVVVAQEDTNLMEAAQFMLMQKHGCLPIFRGNKLIGILTEADFVKLALHLLEKMAEDEQK